MRDWRVARCDCPACGGTWAFATGPSPASARCLRCRLTGTATALLPVLAEHLAATGLSRGTAWEMSTHGPVRPFLARHGIDTVETEFLPGVPSGTVVRGTRCEDATASSFADASLDLVTANQVHEHVEDADAAWREAARILRPGGALVLAVPLTGRPESRRVADTVDGRVVFRGRPEHHASRLTGPDSVPVFWHFSRHDLPARLARAGLVAEWRRVPFLRGSDRASEVLYARRPA